MPTVNNLMKNKPSYYSRENEHSRFGIVNFLKKKKYLTEEAQDAIIKKFLELNNFKEPEKNKKFAKYNFISNRFKKFTIFINVELDQLK